MPGLDDWFLDATGRHNDATEIDLRRHDGRAWTEGNEVEVLIHGAEYFRRLHDVLCGLERGDWVYLTGWEGDDDERLAGPDTQVGKVLADVARRGIDVRGLLWRSHPNRMHFAESDNAAFVNDVNQAGGEILLDERVRRGGSHHQKLIVIRRPGRTADDLAFVGGIDLCHGRNDDASHGGDPQAADLDDRYGPRPPWHDVQLQVQGPAVGDLAYTFRERWEDPTPLDHRNPVRRVVRRATNQPRQPDPLPPMPPDPAPCGKHAVQVLRTYPAKKPRFPFAPEGERSIGHAYLKAFSHARRLVYLEDQYFWSRRAATALAEALRQHPDLHVVVVVPRYPDRDGRVSGPPSLIGRQRVTEMLRNAGGDRFRVYDLENGDGTPIYVHAKVVVIDDVWMTVGSDNLNRRSWTHDSEVTCAVIDSALDERAPADPAGLGDGARVLARDTRLRLWREHLGRADGEDGDLVDPAEAVRAFARVAGGLDRWHHEGRRGARPPGRVRPHEPENVPWWRAWWAQPMHRALLDPDGRPRGMRRSQRL